MRGDSVDGSELSGEWVAQQHADDNPRGDFIRDTQGLLARGNCDPNVEIMNACNEALVQFDRLVRQWEQEERPRSCTK